MVAYHHHQLSVGAFNIDIQITSAFVATCLLRANDEVTGSCCKSTTMSRTLELNCLVNGDDPSHVFTVKIGNDESVSTLKEEIWKKKKPAFDHVPADTLVIWKVSIPIDDDLDPLDTLNLSEEQKLRRPATRLLKVFPHPLEEELIHIIVQSPPAGTCSLFWHSELPPTPALCQ